MALIGKALALLLVSFLLHSEFSAIFNNSVSKWVLVTVALCVCTSLALFFEKPLVTTATSALGSFAVHVAVDVFIRSGFSVIVLLHIVHLQGEISSMSPNPLGVPVNVGELQQVPSRAYVDDRSLLANSSARLLVLSWLLSTMTGVFLQMCVINRTDDEDKNVCCCSNWLNRLKLEK